MILFECEYCQKVFTRKLNLLRHYDRKYKCNDNEIKVVKLKNEQESLEQTEQDLKTSDEPLEQIEQDVKPDKPLEQALEQKIEQKAEERNLEHEHESYNDGLFGTKLFPIFPVKEKIFFSTKSNNPNKRFRTERKKTNKPKTIKKYIP